MWRPKGWPYHVNIYDYPRLAVGPTIAYDAYHVARNEGFVNVGTSRDTAEFAVESIRRWWRLYGQRHYSHAGQLLICAEGGGNNGATAPGSTFCSSWLTNIRWTSPCAMTRPLPARGRRLSIGCSPSSACTERVSPW